MSFLVSRYVPRLINRASKTINQRISKIPQAGFCSQKYSYEITSDPAEWKHVEALLPSSVIPPPPEHDVYPTPSGWLPPDASKQSCPYKVLRTKNHMLPVYIREKRGTTPRKFTVIKFIEGDIWSLERDLMNYLNGLYPDGDPIVSQVHEPGHWLRIRGVFADDVAKYLLEKGF